jgi:hypothetical protein
MSPEKLRSDRRKMSHRKMLQQTRISCSASAGETRCTNADSLQLQRHAPATKRDGNLGGA